ncbi:hypothetical protein FS837_011299 [Tulasnella sp. UAMH 9824]|nr:hypothetical protein FS837_011299 [Tulasnella sp. UAMH 9824]
MQLAYGDSDSESSGSDLDPVRDAVSSKPPPGAIQQDQGETEGAGDATMHDAAQTLDGGQASQQPSSTVPSNDQLLRPPKRKPAPKPRPPRKAPFSERPSLLRNLLLSDIRTTVSNLSQAIRFLVANDFLEGVELKPGEAANPKIAIIEEGSHGMSQLQRDKTTNPSDKSEI